MSYSSPAACEPLRAAEANSLPDVFEGPEKKLEVFFTAPADGVGFRQFSPPVWSDVLADAHCSILHSVGNEAFDAYLLSESSLFVYPHKLILKTCGTTTLLLVLPKLMLLASRTGSVLSHVHYSHFRYAFPQLQPYPHSSFEEEQATVAKLLHDHISNVSTCVLGGAGLAATPAAAPSTAAWYALCAEAPAPLVAAAANPVMPVETDIIELAMEGLAPAVCDVFVGASHMAPSGGTLSQADLSAAMGRVSGVSALVTGATLDEWAFEPCGYSMNALRGPYYYTVHITPEPAFSYASFETNDPAYASDASLRAILDVFKPDTCTVTVTSRAAHAASASARLGDAPPAAHSLRPPADLFATSEPWRTTRLSEHVSVSVASYISHAAVAGSAPVGVATGDALKYAQNYADKCIGREMEDTATSSDDSESTQGQQEQLDGDTADDVACHGDEVAPDVYGEVEVVTATADQNAAIGA